MRKRKSERGQALAELIISMIGLCAVTIGLMVVAVLGMSGIRNTIAAREKADQNSISGIENGSAQNIDTWKNGQDGLTFTNDDVCKSGASPNSEIFLGELKDNTGTFSTAMLSKTEYAEHAFESKVIESDILLSAARLTMAREVVSEPLQLYKHFDAARIMKALGFTSNFTLIDTISMPVNPLE